MTMPSPTGLASVLASRFGAFPATPGTIRSGDKVQFRAG
jgi:hypothetical protein